MPVNNYTLGRGRVHFSRFKPGTQEPEGFRYIGNTPEFSMNIETEELDHFSSDGGIREKDDSISLEVTRSGSLTTDNISAENVAIFFFGTASMLTTASATAAPYVIEDAQRDRSYKIGATAQNPVGLMGINPVGVTVTIPGTPDPVALVAGTDYELDAPNGIITFLENANAGIDGATDVTVTCAVLGTTRTRVISGSAPVEGAMMYVTRNPKGEDCVFYLPWVKVMPNGDYALKGDEWQTIPLMMEILKRDNVEAIYRDGTPFAT